MNLSASLLTLFGGGSQQASTSMGPSETLALYKTSLDQADKESARIRRDPAVKRDLDRLEKAIAKAKTPEELLKNPETLRVILQGLGLADQAQNTALAQKALLSDPADPKSLAARLTDTRWKGAAEQLGFAKMGLTKIRNAEIRGALADGVVEYRRLTAISEKSQAVADALYIRKLPADADPGVYGVLGDPVLRRVATTVAGLPPQLALQTIEGQARSLTKRFDVEQFTDPKAREKLIQRYLATASAGGISLLI